MINRKLFNNLPYSIEKNYFKKSYLKEIINLTKYHFDNCKTYKKLLDTLNYKLNKKTTIQEIPFIPTRLFKNYELMSVKKNKIIKTLVSSGTSSQGHSKIFLDKVNSENQVKALKNIISSILGNLRLPMLIIDKNPKYYNRNQFSAKTAAILGFSIFGKNHFYILDKNGNIDYEGIKKFFETYKNNKVFIFGFTSNIYEIFLKKLILKNIDIDLSNSVLLHGGGWKKLEKYKISNSEFKKKLVTKFKIKKIYNYYGTIEQAGSIFLECENCGGFKTSRYSDILIRDKDFKVLPKLKKGIIQIFSILPTSYPGHSLLTEDEGLIIHDKDCTRNFEGKCFLIKGRLAKAELRGCSDVNSD